MEAEKEFEALAASLGLKFIAWRTVPTDSNAIGAVARKSEPVSRQIFVTGDFDEETLKKKVVIKYLQPCNKLTCFPSLLIVLHFSISNKNRHSYFANVLHTN